MVLSVYVVVTLVQRNCPADTDGIVVDHPLVGIDVLDEDPTYSVVGVL